jgi:hypothetical protein
MNICVEPLGRSVWALAIMREIDRPAIEHELLVAGLDVFAPTSCQ